MTDMTLNYRIENKNPKPLTVLWTLGCRGCCFTGVFTVADGAVRNGRFARHGGGRQMFYCVAVGRVSR